MHAPFNRCCTYGHSVTSAHVDLAIDNNGTWQDAFQFGQPTDLSWTLAGQTFECDVQRNRYDKTALLSLSSGGGTIVVDDVFQRVIHFNVSPTAIQAALVPGDYVYDLVMVDGSSPPVRVPLMHGFLTVEQGVTYPP
jgi:hypothetical protein